MLSEKTLIFDFDGVIVNSSRECFLIAWWAYHGVEEIEEEMFVQDHLEAELVFNKFRYLVGPAHEYYFLLKSICDHLGICNGSLPDLFKKYSKECERESRTFSAKFFRIRDIARDKFRKRWIGLNPLYPGMPEFLRWCLKKKIIYIASTKDENSIDTIIKENRLEIPREHIFGKERCLDKRTHVREILRQTNYFPAEVAFIDDNPLHLARVRPLGVKIVFASWGYGGPHGKAAALKLGAKILTIPKLKEMVS